MTRKDFRALTAALKAVRPTYGTVEYGQWLDSVDAAASVCARANPRFDRVSFNAACDIILE